MRTVGSFEAKTDFAELLQQVEAAHAAADRIRALARKTAEETAPSGYDWEEWKSYRDAGRR
jgi:hypothetical protein